MVYKTETFEMRGYPVLHPTIQLAKYLKVFAEIVFAVLVLHWGWVTSYSNHAFALLVGVSVLMYVIYKINSN